MPARVLCVDDEPRVLKGIRRSIGRDYRVDIAEGGQAALELMRSAELYHVVISDMRMPGMSGAQFLAHARSEFPDTVRMLLTGQSDLNDAIAAVNQGSIFRFLSKPCPPDVLAAAVADAVEQFRLVVAERELLEGTVRGSVALLTEILSIKDPAAYARGARLKNHVARIGAQLELEGAWDVEVAAMMTEVGSAIVPGDIAERATLGDQLSASEQRIWNSRNEVVRDLLGHIPRLENVAAIVGGEDGDDADAESHVAIGIRVLEAAAEYDELVQGGMKPGAAVTAMRSSEQKYGSDVMRALERVVAETGGFVEKTLSVGDLVSGVVLATDLVAVDGRLLLTEGSEVSHAALARIKQYADHVGVREPIRVRVTV
jgi:response regulator RpfG family c-di-GMP phosphodiesterase